MTMPQKFDWTDISLVLLVVIVAIIILMPR